jgi:hypothetical protein
MSVPARITIVTLGVDDLWEVAYNPSFPVGDDGRITIS